MTTRYTCRFPVRHYELDFYHHVNNAVHVQYLQQAAIDAAEAVGYGVAWCRGRGAGWVIRRLTIRYLLPVNYPDEVAILTWISQVKGARCWRESELRRGTDGKVAVRARAEWVLLDRGTGQPQRIPAEVSAAFAPTGEQEDLGVRLVKARATPEAHRYKTRRRVQVHELDTAVHVNHATYLQWIGQAYFDALATSGHPVDLTGAAGWTVWQGGHDLEYLAPAPPGAPIELVSWVCEVARVRGAWTHEVRHGGTGQLLARDYSLGVFVDPTGRPMAAPPHVVADVLRGPPDAAAAPGVSV